MPSCSVYGCTNNSGMDAGLYFYRFPFREKSPVRFRKWRDCTNRKDFNPGLKSVICSEHFLPSDFNQRDVLKWQLMPNYKHKFPKLKPGTVPQRTSVDLTGKPIAPNNRSKSSRDARHQKRLNKQIVEDLLKNGPGPSFCIEASTSTTSLPLTPVCSNYTNIMEPLITIKVEDPYKDTGSQVELGTEMMREIHGNVFFREFTACSSQVEFGVEIMRRFELNGNIKSEPEVFF